MSSASSSSVSLTDHHRHSQSLAIHSSSLHTLVNALSAVQQKLQQQVALQQIHNERLQHEQLYNEHSVRYLGVGQSREK